MSTTYQINLGTSNSTSITSAADSLDSLANKLTEAGSAAERSNEALRAGEAAYKASQSAADRLSKAVERVNATIAEKQVLLERERRSAADTGDVSKYLRLKGALSELVIKQGQLTSKAAEANDALGKQAQNLDRLRTGSKSAADALDKATKANDAAKSAAAKASGSGKLNEAAEALGKIGGPVGRLGQQALGAATGVQKLVGSLGESTGPALLMASGVGIVVAAVAALVAITVTGIASLASWSVGLADGKRSAALLAQGLAGGVAEGNSLNATIYKLQNALPQTRDELNSMAADLAKTGLQGEELNRALENSAYQAARLKWGPEFAKQTVSLDKLSSRFGENIKSIFGGLKVDGLLDALSKMVDLLDENSVTGKALKTVFESVMQPLLDGIVSVIPAVIRGFIQLEIWVLKAMIFLKPYREQIATVAEVLLVLAGVTALVGAAFMVSLFAPFTLMVGAAALVVYAVLSIKDALVSAYNYVASIDFATVGLQLMQGLANGIMSGASNVMTSIKSVAGSAISAAQNALGIASPSKVFAEIGAYTAEGMQVGVESGTSGVQGSIENLVAPPGPGDVTNSSTTTNGASVNLAGATFIFQGVSGGEEALASFKRMLTSALEGDVAQLGGAVPA